MAVTSLASAQVRPPNYSPDAIPETSFTCEDKITGGYYADQEADCQLFHVCVQVSEYEVGPIFLTKVIGSLIRLDIFIRLEIFWCFHTFTIFTLKSLRNEQTVKNNQIANSSTCVSKSPYR